MSHNRTRVRLKRQDENGLSNVIAQLPQKHKPSDNIIWINGVRVTNKDAVVREAKGQYPVLCQFNETGRPHQLSNPFRHWKRRFDDEISLKWALGDIEGSFIATIRPVYVDVVLRAQNAVADITT
ncbi:MAG: hypothetical protein Q7S50_03660 [bacterium]|nr:hypothetical protein [bacterium]